MTQSSAAAARPPTTSRLMFWVALLYFSEGLPLGLFFDLFPVHLRQAGVGPAEIGLLSLLGLAWTVKFLWAPLVDALDIPLLSRKLGSPMRVVAPPISRIGLCPARCR